MLSVSSLFAKYTWAEQRIQINAFGFFLLSFPLLKNRAFLIAPICHTPVNRKDYPEEWIYRKKISVVL